MFEINEQVMVINEKKYFGIAYIIDICFDEIKLEKYFHKDHPKYNKYKISLMNNEPVYIVKFGNDMGQGGYLNRELKKKR